MQITVNETGARTLADARPMLINGKNVYVFVGSGASLHVDGRIVAYRENVTEMTTAEAQAWAVEYRNAMNTQADAAQAEAQNHMDSEAAQQDADTDWDDFDWDTVDTTNVDWDAVEEATNIEAVYADAVAQIRESAKAIYAQAMALKTAANSTFKIKGRTIAVSDPRHPMQAFKTLRDRAAIYAAWTAQDEAGYSRYVSDGIGATDGYYAPLTRDAWKATLAI